MGYKIIAAMVITTLLMSQCGPPIERVQYRADRPGGLYELNPLGKAFVMSDGSDTLMLDTTSFISFAEFRSVQKDMDEYDRESLTFWLSPSGTTLFAEMTERNIGKPICLVVNEKILMSPSIPAPIPNGKVSLTGSNIDTEALMKYLRGE